MSVYPLQDPRPPDEAAAAALRMIGDALDASQLAGEQFQSARHDAAQASQADARAQAAREQSVQAQARVAAEQLKAGPHQRIPRSAGTALAVLLAALDAVPAYWSSQAFGLDQISTLIVTVLLCSALAGAMFLMELFSSQGRRRALRILQASLAGGLLALFVLRLDYLQVTGAVSLWLAAIQALALTALSAVLVATGYVLLAHRVPRTLAAARRAARQADPGPAAAAAQAARAQASDSRNALGHTVITWALARPHDTIPHDQLIPALTRAIDTLLEP